MRGRRKIKIRIWPAPVLYCIIFFIWMMVWFAGYYKMSVLFSAVAAVLLFVVSDIRKLQRLSVLFLFGYVFVSGISIFWAVSGKFFLREFSKIFFAEILFLFVIFCGKKTAEFGKQVLEVLTGVASLFGFFSVEAASTGMIRIFLEQFQAFRGTFLWFEPGTRLTGILGNANVLASILAFGVIFSVLLLYSAEEKKKKLLFAVYSGITSYAFLLCFSLGAVACFLVSMVIYLVFAGKERGGLFVSMVVIAVPTLVTGFLSFPCFDRDGFFRVLPLFFLAVDIIAIFYLEAKVSGRFVRWLEKYGRILPWILSGFFVAGIVFILLAYHVSVPYTFGRGITRSAYPGAGKHHLRIEADADVTVHIISQTRAQTMMHTNSEVYEGTAKDAGFTVPEGSVVCYFTFTANPGTRLRSVSVDGKEKIRLRYLFLPGSIANRLQGLWANQNFVQRLVFYRDGIHLFSKHPVCGNGVGAFEAAVASVQDFYYETKYVHDHYIQIMLETGVAGSLFYIIFLFRLFYLFIKKRKDGNEIYGLVCPSLAAAFFMVLFHSLVEVSMSSVAFLCMAYVLFGLISLLFDGADVKDVRDGKEIGEKKNRSRFLNIGCRIVGSVLCIAYALTLIGNFYAARIIQESSDRGKLFLGRIGEAVSMDIYEKNDYKLSYLYCVADTQAYDYLDKANAYAEELLKVQSNSIPKGLVYYFLQTGQPVKAVQAAEAGAGFSASDPKVWNQCITLLREALWDEGHSRLLTDGKTLLPLLKGYVGIWKERNRTAMEEIVLEPENLDFFSKVEQLSGGEMK